VPSVIHRESDGRLVSLTRDGSEKAFAEIVRRYEKALLSYCQRLVGADRARDAVQQAFLQAYLALKSESAEEVNLRPWLYRISRNCAIDLLRRNGWEYDELDPALPGAASPPVVLEQRQRLREVLSAIHKLPDRQRRALLLREVEGRSYGEIAPALGEGTSGINQLIFRARTRLREAVGAIVPLDSLRALLARAAAAVSERSQQALDSVSGTGAGGVMRRMGAVALATVGLLADGNDFPLGTLGPAEAGRPSINRTTALPSQMTTFGLGELSETGLAHRGAKPAEDRSPARANAAPESGAGVELVPGTLPPAPPAVTTVPPGTGVVAPQGASDADDGSSSQEQELPLGASSPSSFQGEGSGTPSQSSGQANGLGHAGQGHSEQSSGAGHSDDPHPGTGSLHGAQASSLAGPPAHASAGSAGARGPRGPGTAAGPR
jgi:RNA polymerase sigma factor (sigma-70 family)